MSSRKFRNLVTIAMLCLVSGITRHNIFTTDVQGIHTWRQSQTMWNVRNFYRHDANILNPRISHFNNNADNLYRYEFPILQWSIAMLQHVFGEEVVVFRSILFVLGCLGVLGIFFLFRSSGLGELSSLLSTGLFAFSPLYYFYSLNPLPDLLSLVSGIWYLVYFIKYIRTKSYLHLVVALVFLLIAGLSKLPYLMLGIFSLLHFIKEIRTSGRRPSINIERSSVIFLLLHIFIIVPIISWYAWVMPGWNGNGVLSGIFDNATPIDRILFICEYHLRIMIPLILMTPLGVLFLILGFVNKQGRSTDIFYLWNGFVVLSILYWILEFNMIDTNHDYYLLPLLIWIYYLIGWGIEWLLKFPRKRIMYVLLFVSCFSSIVYAHFLTIEKWSISSTFPNDDVFLFSEELKKAVPADAKCIIMNDGTGHIFSYQVDKMGYVFYNDHVPMHWIHDMVLRKDVKYMYSDSEKINDEAIEAGFIKELIMKKGSVSVFKMGLPD